MHLRLLAVLAVFVLVACKGKGTLEGHLTINGAPVASAQVVAVPEKDIAAYVASKRGEAATLAALRAEYADAGRVANAGSNQMNDLRKQTVAPIQGAGGVTVSPAGSSGMAFYQYDPTKMTAAQAESAARAAATGDAARAYQQRAEELARQQRATTQSLKTQMDASRESQMATLRKIQQWEQSVFADFAPPPGAPVAFSDAKGAFTFEVPKSGRVAIIATANVTFNGVTGQRTWAIWTTLDGAAKKELRLTEANLISADPSDSLLK